MFFTKIELRNVLNYGWVRHIYYLGSHWCQHPKFNLQILCQFGTPLSSISITIVMVFVESVKLWVYFNDQFIHAMW